MLTLLTYRAWRQVLYCGCKNVSSILTLRIRQGRKDEEQQYREELHVGTRIEWRRTRWLSQSEMSMQIPCEIGSAECPARERGRTNTISDNSSHVNRVLRIPYEPGYNQGLILYAASRGLLESGGRQNLASRNQGAVSMLQAQSSGAANLVTESLP